MKTINNLYERFFPSARPLPPGVYHYQAPTDAPKPYRLHLRIENDGTGILILNASTVLHLNHTAAELAYYIIKQTPPDEIIRQMVKRYDISTEEAQRDYHDLKERLETMIVTPDLDPVTFLDLERKEPYSGSLSAPYRIDCALTYQLPEERVTGITPVDRVKRELRTDEWKTILKKAWDAGVPHAIFTGGEPTLRPDLVELVQYTEDIGMVVGLISSGDRLSNIDFLHQLLTAGLDHLMLVLDPEDDVAWEALRDVMPEDLYTTVHLTITSENARMITEEIRQLAIRGVTSLSLSAISIDLKDALDQARQVASELNMTLVWDLPVPYSEQNPVSLELQSTDTPAVGAGQAWIYVEPDGDVLPAQGDLTLMGNLLTNSWEQVWKNRPKSV